MSDKPIDDYDENNRNITDGHGNGSANTMSRSGHNYYRSPLIMRNEKPPMPAPPEYTRQSYDFLPNKPNNDKLILNELQNILHKDIQSVLAESPASDESALLIDSKKSSQANTYYKSSSSSQSSPPSSADDNLMLISEVSSRGRDLREVSKKLHEAIGSGETTTSRHMSNSSANTGNKRQFQHEKMK